MVLLYSLLSCLWPLSWIIWSYPLSYDTFLLYIDESTTHKIWVVLIYHDLRLMSCSKPTEYSVSWLVHFHLLQIQVLGEGYTINYTTHLVHLWFSFMSSFCYCSLCSFTHYAINHPIYSFSSSLTRLSRFEYICNTFFLSE